MPATRIFKDVDQVRALDMSGIGNGPFIFGADNEPEAATFGISIQNIVPAATPTDWVTIAGAAGKVLRVKSLVFAGVATAASNIFVNLFKRTVLDTYGTFSVLTPVSHDTADGASAATVRQCTANPSALGTGSIIHGGRLNLAPAANGSIDRLIFQYTWQNDKAIVLRGVNESLAINLGGIAWPSGGALDLDMMWTEE